MQAALMMLRGNLNSSLTDDVSTNFTKSSCVSGAG